jgi:SAM-dependent methyltransferase
MIEPSMKAAQLLRRVNNKLRLPLPLFKILNGSKPRFECPICAYEGPFVDLSSFAGVRKHAECPRCGALERHRLQYLAIMHTLSNVSTPIAKMLHFAPEEFLRRIFVRSFSNYETADLFMEGVDHRVDIQHLPFEDASYDVLFASHVLEHIRDDRQAIREIRRVLRPNGIAILPVPIVCTCTIEYPDANPYEAGHVRAPGLDYFDRYMESFSTVDIQRSESFPEKHQLFIYEDRSKWPTRECPLRPPMLGWRHSDFVPICHV